MPYYKSFTDDFISQEYQFEIGCTKVTMDPVFYCYDNPLLCLFYTFCRPYKFCEVSVGIDHFTKNDKIYSRELTIERQIYGEELDNLLTGCLEMDNGKSQFWYKAGKVHRDGDLPATIHRTGSMCWYKNGKVHREEDLPAEIHSNGCKFWFIDDEEYRNYVPRPIPTHLPLDNFSVKIDCDCLESILE